MNKSIAMISLALAGFAAQAGTVQFSSRAAFEAAAPGAATETFNAVRTPARIAGAYDYGAFKVGNPNDAAVGQVADADYIAIDGTPYLAGVGNFGDTMSFRFSSAIDAFGIDLLSINNDEERTRIRIGGRVFTLPVTGDEEISFFGVVSDSAFTQVDFQVVSAANEGAVLDNLSTRAAAARELPEPASIALLVLGLAGLAMRRRERA